MEEKIIHEVVMKMSEFADGKYELPDLTDKEWFLTKSWTKEQEQQFKKWLVNKLLTNKDYRHVLSRAKTKMGKKYYEKLADYFCFNFGWRLEDIK